MISDMKPRSKKGWPAGKPAHIGTAGKQRLPSVFTVWDVNRDTATVFAACREHGEVTIRSRTGEQFVIRPTGSVGELAFDSGDQIAKLRKHHEHLRRLGYVPPPPEQEARLERIIAGEE